MERHTSDCLKTPVSLDLCSPPLLSLSCKRSNLDIDSCGCGRECVALPHTDKKPDQKYYQPSEIGGYFFRTKSPWPPAQNGERITDVTAFLSRSIIHFSMGKYNNTESVTAELNQVSNYI